MTRYAYYDGHAGCWVVTADDPGPGRILRIELTFTSKDDFCMTAFDQTTGAKVYDSFEGE